VQNEEASGTALLIAASLVLFCITIQIFRPCLEDFRRVMRAHGRGEPFLWGTTRGELVDLMRPWRVIGFFDHDNFRSMESDLADEPIAKGEVICLAEI
jgi:hypothetical protein